MDNDRHLTFRQRYGYEYLPSPMKVGELSDDFRRELWNWLWEFIESNTITSHGVALSGSRVYFNDLFSSFIRRIMGKFWKLTIDDVSTECRFTVDNLRQLVLQGSPEEHFLPFVEIMADDGFMLSILLEELSSLFDKHQAAYRLDITERPHRVFKRTSVEESDATLQSIEKLKAHGFEAALSHLRQAATHINTGQFPDSIADSIHAVESVARSITPNENSLGKALDKLKAEGKIKHAALIEGFKKIYGYTSNEEGIRHALINLDTANVDEPLALFFYNACAAFAGYLATVGGER